MKAIRKILAMVTSLAILCGGGCNLHHVMSLAIAENNTERVAAMAQNETWLNHDLMEAVKVQYLDGNLFSQDNAGNLIGVRLTRDGVDYSGGGSVSANVIRADGATVSVVGALSGNIATVVLPQAAYAVPGVVSIVVKLTVSGEVTTIAAVVANVYQSSTDSTVDPGTIIPSVQALISAIETAVASIPADYSSLWTSLAPAFSTSTNYTAGQYVTYNGALYRFTVDHAAGAWNSAHVTATNLGCDLNSLKSAFNNYRKGIDVTFTGGSSNVYKFNIQIIKGFKYFVTNSTGGNISLNVYKNGVSTSIYATVSNNSTIYFIAGDDYDQIGGWFNNAGNIRVWSDGEETTENGNYHRIENDVIGSNEMKGYFDLYSTFDRGNLYQGVGNIAYLYRVRSDNIITVDHDYVISVKTGFRYFLDIFVNGSYSYTVNFRTTDYAIAKGTQFKICIARVTEDTTEIADIDAFVKAVWFDTVVGQEITSIDNELDYLTPGVYNEIVPEFEQGQIIDFTPGESTKAVRNKEYIYMPKGGKVVFKKRNFQILINFYTYPAETSLYQLRPAQSLTVNANAEGVFTTDRNGYLRISVTKGSGADFVPSELNNLVVFAQTVSGSIAEQAAVEDFGSSFSLKENDTEEKLLDFYELITGDTMDNYLFFTDAHIMGAQGSYPKMTLAERIAKVEKYYKSSPCGLVVYGGDTLNLQDTPAQAKYKLGLFSGIMRGLFGNAYKPMIGNHDYNYIGTELLTANEIANVMNFKIGKNYYQFESNNTTYFVLDTGVESDDNLTTYRLQQLDWLADSLLADTKEHKAILFHVYYIIGTTVSVFAQKIGEIISAFNSRGTVTIYEGSIRNFANAQGKVEYSLVGHSHRDFETTLGGVPLIGSINFSDGASFDLVNVNYTTKKINMVRIGTGNNRSINLT